MQALAACACAEEGGAQARRWRRRSRLLTHGPGKLCNRFAACACAEGGGAQARLDEAVAGAELTVAEAELTGRGGAN